MSKAFVDVGELGWALYLTAHLHWRDAGDLVFTDRPALYPNCKTKSVPKEFYTKYGKLPADCLSRQGLGYKTLAQFFRQFTTLPVEMYKSYSYKTIYKGEMVFKPYKATSKFGEDAITIFPRYRKSEAHAVRNIPQDFYQELIDLLLRVTDQDILLVGSGEAYKIESSNRRVFDWTGKTDVQDLLDVCTNSHLTIGGTSAPPKMALLQGTPSFIVGHERERFVYEENWSDTRVGFYELEDYQNFDYERCLNNIHEWVDKT